MNARSRLYSLHSQWSPRLALLLLLGIVAHALWQTLFGLFAGKSLPEVVPILEKPIAEFGKWVGLLLTWWMPDWSIETPLGPLFVKRTVSYTLYEWVKLPLILFLTTFGMALLRLKAGARGLEKTLGRDDWLGAVGGTVMGMLTPVCSCTVTNIYAGLVAGGASRKASTAFLFASPALNEFAIVFMFTFGSLSGGAMYLGFGFVAAVLTAYLAPALGLTPGDFINKIAGLTCHTLHLSKPSPLQAAFVDAQAMLRRLLFPLLLSGFLAGVLVNFNLGLIQVMKNIGYEWWGPIVGTLLGLPLDINAASTAPILAALSGVVPTGTLVSVMMATTVSSLPEVSMLQRLLGKAATMRLVGWYAAYTMLIGLVINLAGL
ncbi:MAG: permease [Anaerolineales bacterium]|nr:permease [Anaerolineales bacterium]